MRRVGVVGASGYTGVELIKILARHKDVKIEVLNSESFAGKKVKEVEPSVNSGLKFTNYSIEQINKLCLDLIFLAMPNGKAMKIVPKLNCRIIDLSGDYRFGNFKIYEHNYRIKHLDKKTKAVYGLPELFRGKIAGARVVANPGCYATACLLAALPVQKLPKYMIFDCKSGYSGAGKKPAYVNDPKNYTDNVIAYSITKHRHKAEAEQFLKSKISFTPHVIPVFRGLMCTMHAILNEKIKGEKVKSIYKNFYKKEKFIKILGKIPELHDAQNTNNCCIGGFEADSSNRLVVVSTIDNLLKGASGQAVQNMNIMLGFDESEGLLELKKN